MNKLSGCLICLAVAALAGCSTPEFPNMNTQAAERPQGLMSPQQSEAEIAALDALAAQHAAQTEREIAGQ
ncbi:MAG TPA: hypothetical protein VK844_08570 [Hyphomicrobiales bacterium]|nr:hypothetical protein [Hyphomicrobiales bacterium]